MSTPHSQPAIPHTMQLMRAPANGYTQAQTMSANLRVSHGGVPTIGVPTLLCASGRGGSGTTLMSVLVAVAAAGDGHRVLLIDGDDLVGPAAMLLGVTPVVTWQQLRAPQVIAEQVAIPVSETLMFVAGGAPQGVDATPLNAMERRAAMRRLAPLTDGADLVVIDCGSRLDAIAAAITPHTGERLLAVAAGTDPVTLASTFALCKAARIRNAGMSLDVLVNRLSHGEAVRCFETLDAGARQFLGTTLTYAGSVPFDQTLDAALKSGMPFWDAAVGSPAAIAAHDVVSRMLSNATPSLSRTGT